MAGVDDDRVRLLRDDLVGEVHQRIRSDGRHGGRDHLDLALRVCLLEAAVERAGERCAEAVGKAGGARLPLHEDAEAARRLLCGEERGLDAHPGRGGRVSEEARDGAWIRLQVRRLLRALDEQRFEVVAETCCAQCQFCAAEQHEGQGYNDCPQHDPAAA